MGTVSTQGAGVAPAPTTTDSVTPTLSPGTSDAPADAECVVEGVCEDVVVSEALRVPEPVEDGVPLGVSVCDELPDGLAVPLLLSDPEPLRDPDCDGVGAGVKDREGDLVSDGEREALGVVVWLGEGVVAWEPLDVELRVRVSLPDPDCVCVRLPVPDPVALRVWLCERVSVCESESLWLDVGL